MWRSMLKVAAATAAFGIVHSALASKAVKHAAARHLGERNRNGLYRVFYNVQAGATFGTLVVYIGKQPSRELYRIRGPLALALHAIHVGAAVYAVSALRQVGVARFAGLESFVAWLGSGPVPQEPEGQGPALDYVGLQRRAGPFAWSRHPLNFVPVPICWLWPRMTTNLLAFNIASTVYLIVGSKHEELRLQQAYGSQYDAYTGSVPHFYIPMPQKTVHEETAAIARG